MNTQEQKVVVDLGKKNDSPFGIKTNVPLTKEQIQILPMGFTATSSYATRNMSSKGSKYIKSNRYNAPRLKENDSN